VTRPLALALLLAHAPVAAARGTPALLLPSGLGRPDVAWIAGRVLEEQHGRHGPKAVRTARTLAGSNLPGVEVEVRFLGRTVRAVSGHDGEFEAVVEAAPGDPFPPGTHQAAVSARGASAQASIRVIAPDAPLLVVTDFDDTVAVTQVTSTHHLLAATFLQDAETQPAVAGMAALLRCLAARGAPVAFVSGTPVQLAPRMARFLERNGFPPAALYLRNLGTGTLRGYKEPVLERLADRFPQARLVLLGDTGERDPEIYAAFARAHPGRVARAYLRQATPAPVPPARLGGALLFQDPAAAARDAAANGLADEACVGEAFGAAPGR
jgi:phosphatidate phosphatase APP1